MEAVTLLCFVDKMGFWFSQSELGPCKSMSSAGTDPRGAVTAGVLTLVSAEELLVPWLWC